MATVLTINGSTVSRPANRLILNQVTLSLDGVDTLEFTEVGTRLPGNYTAGQTCVLAVDGTTYFSGRIVGSYPRGMGRGPIDVGYRALGLNWLANLVTITAADGTGRMVYNLPNTDPDYVASQSGKSVGDILKLIFDQHSSQLTAQGITGYTAGDLTVLTVVPPEPVIVQGRLWNACQELLANWQNKYILYIEPATGTIRVRNALTISATTITLDSDPVYLDAISRDHSECYTQVIIRGQAQVMAAYLSTAEGTLVEGFSSGDKSAWSLNDYYQPKGSADVGTINSMTSTTLTVKSDNTALTWTTNYWAGLNAEVVAWNPAATGITFSEAARVSSNTSLSAGGTSVLTVDVAFANSGYTRYSIRGLYATAALTWRKYTLYSTYVAQHLVRNFNHSEPWATTDGVVSQVTTPQAVVCWSPSGAKPYNEFPVLFDIIPYDGTTNGYIIFHEPVVKPFGTPAKLLAGGSAVDGVPSDIKVIVPYSRGAMSTTKPTSSYEGTAYTVDGIQRTLYLDYPQWVDVRDNTNYATLAQEKLDTVKNTVVEGSFTWMGKNLSLLALGQSINIAHPSYTTGYTAINAPIRSVSLDYQDSTTQWVMRVSFSNRLRPFSGDRLYAHSGYRQAEANQFGLRGRAATVAANPIDDFLASQDNGPAAIPGMDFESKGKGGKQRADDAATRKSQSHWDARKAKEEKDLATGWDASAGGKMDHKANQRQAARDMEAGFDAAGGELVAGNRGTVNEMLAMSGNKPLTEGQQIEKDQQENARRIAAKTDARNREKYRKESGERRLADETGQGKTPGGVGGILPGEL